MCATCGWSVPTAKPGAARSIHRRERSRRRDIFFTRTRNSLSPTNERGWSSQVQLDAMAEEGIDVAILYPSRGLNLLSVPDLEPRIRRRSRPRL